VASPPPPGPGIDFDALSTGATLETLSKVEVDRLKGIEAIIAQRQKTAISRGELVERESVAKFVNKLFQIHINQLQVLDRNITPDIDALYENTDPEKSVKTAEIINDSVFKTLGHIKREAIEWLEKIGLTDNNIGGNDME
jgi:hypothetical protein